MKKCITGSKTEKIRLSIKTKRRKFIYDNGQNRAHSHDHRRAQLGKHRSFPVRPRRVDLRRTGRHTFKSRLHTRCSRRNLVHLASFPFERRSYRIIYLTAKICPRLFRGHILVLFEIHIFLQHIFARRKTDEMHYSGLET